jgi:hypothetical protein
MRRDVGIPAVSGQRLVTATRLVLPVISAETWWHRGDKRRTTRRSRLAGVTARCHRCATRRD